jgi:hypothetical protein
MLHSIARAVIQIVTVALLTAGATLTPLSTNAIAAPGGYGAQSGDDACFSSPGSISHNPCVDSGGN